MPKVGVDMRVKETVTPQPVVQNPAPASSNGVKVRLRQPTMPVAPVKKGIDLSDVQMVVGHNTSFTTLDQALVNPGKLVVMAEKVKKGCEWWALLRHPMSNPIYDWDTAGVCIDVRSFHTEKLYVDCYASAPTDLREDLVKTFTFHYEDFDQCLRMVWDWYNEAMKWIAERVAECTAKVLIPCVVRKVRNIVQPTPDNHDNATAMVQCSPADDEHDYRYCWVTLGVTVPAIGDVVHLSRKMGKYGWEFWDNVTLQLNKEEVDV